MRGFPVSEIDMEMDTQILEHVLAVLEGAAAPSSDRLRAAAPGRAGRGAADPDHRGAGEPPGTAARGRRGRQSPPVRLI